MFGIGQFKMLSKPPDFWNVELVNAILKVIYYGCTMLIHGCTMQAQFIVSLLCEGFFNYMSMNVSNYIRPLWCSVWKVGSLMLPREVEPF